MDQVNYFSIFSGIGILFAGLGFAYSQFKSGSSKAKDELISTLRESATAEKDKAERLATEKTLIVTSHQEQINQLNEKIGKLQGLYEANETQKQEYLQILQGRNPAQEQFMKYLTEVATESAKYMKDTSAILGEIKTFMAIMNGEVAKGNLFNKQIVDDTKHGKGEILRKQVD